MSSKSFTRRDILKMGGGFIVGLAAGYAIGYYTAPRVEIVKPSGKAETVEARRQTKATAGKKKVKIAVVSFLSGPASVFGVPAANMADVIVDMVNREGGINGAEVEIVKKDEAGKAEEMVALYRRLVEQEGIDIYVGLISSSHCLAVAPVAEEIGTTLTVFFDCATKRLVDKRMMRRVVFRTGGTSVQDAVSLAMKVLEVKPDVRTVVGLNQDYAYGRDEWNDFITVLRRLKPDVEVLDELWTPLFTTDYSAQISKILDLRPDLVHTSFWGPDLANFVEQAATRGLFKTTTVAFARGESMLQQLGEKMPEGQIVQGPHYFEYPDPKLNLLNRRVIEEYKRRFGIYPPYPAYHMANALLGVKYAIETAALVSGEEWPDLSTIIKVFERLAYPAPGDYIIMAPHHNAVRGSIVGVTTKREGYGFKVLGRRKYFSPSEINPPVELTSEEWYRSIG